MILLNSNFRYQNYQLKINTNMKLKVTVASLFIICNIFCFAQKPSKEPLTGEISKAGMSIGKCNIANMTVKFMLYTTMGEPALKTNLKWTKGYSTDLTCLQGESFEIFIKVSYGGSDYLIEAEAGTIPKGNGEWGINTLAGSPDWDELFVLYDYQTVKAFQSNRKYLSAEQAKKIWKAGFSIRGIAFIDTDGKTVTMQQIGF